ncbi:MAG: hypothetical protein AB1430_09190 [Pseudomonadota bacterium]
MSKKRDRKALLDQLTPQQRDRLKWASGWASMRLITLTLKAAGTDSQAQVQIRAPGGVNTVPLAQLEKALEGYGVKVPIRWSEML